MTNLNDLLAAMEQTVPCDRKDIFDMLEKASTTEMTSRLITDYLNMMVFDSPAEYQPLTISTDTLSAIFKDYTSIPVMACFLEGEVKYLKNLDKNSPLFQ